MFSADNGKESIPIRLGGDEFMLFKKLQQTGGRDNRSAHRRHDKNIILNTEKGHQVAASIGMCSTEVTDNITRCTAAPRAP